MSRTADISALLFAQGETPVTDLARLLGASLATIRRDLVQLEQQGLVERIHGAARLASTAKAEVGHKAREDRNLAAKRAIARIAYGQLRAGDTVLLDAGTTVLQLARQIRLAPMPLTVVTNGLAVAQELADVPEVQLCLLGGRLRPGQLSVVGPLAETMLQSLWLTHAFLGASALSHDLWLSSFDAEEARLNATMAARADQVWVLADHSKLGPRATFAVRHLTGAETLITDRALPNAMADHAATLGMTVLLPPTADPEGVHV